MDSVSLNMMLAGAVSRLSWRKAVCLHLRELSVWHD